MSLNKINKNFFADSILKSLLFWNLFFLLVSLIIGRYYFSNSMGWGDSLDIFKSPIDLNIFISYWYKNINGRLGQTILTSFFLPFRWFSSTPEEFPWWLASSIGLFSAISAAFNFSASLSSVINKSNTLLLSVVLFISWSLNPVAFYNREFFTLMELIAYSFPVYLISLCVYSLSQSYYKNNINQAHIVFLLFIGIFFSLLGEQYLLATPIIFSGYLLAKYLNGKVSFNLLTIIISVYIIGELLGLLIYWNSPGQMIRRNLLASLPAFSLWEFYEQPVVNSYQMILGFSQILIDKWKYYILFIHTTLILFSLINFLIIFLRYKKIYNYYYVNSSIYLITYLVAFHACFITLLIAAYLPGYAYYFPLLLLVMSLIITLKILLYFIIDSVKIFYLRNLILLALVTLCALTIFNIFYQNISRDMAIRKLSVENNIRRKDVYSQIVDLNKRTGAAKVLLFDCPLAYPEFGWTMEPPWGLAAYFSWINRPTIKVYLKGNTDFPENWNDGSYDSISCDNIISTHNTKDN